MDSNEVSGLMHFVLFEEGGVTCIVVHITLMHSVRPFLLYKLSFYSSCSKSNTVMKANVDVL